MKELGVDLGGVQPRKLTTSWPAKPHLLITMGCGEACPDVPGLRRDDWPLEDPKGKPVERVREIRDDVARRVRHLVENEGWTERAMTRDTEGLAEFGDRLRRFIA